MPAMYADVRAASLPVVGRLAAVAAIALAVASCDNGLVRDRRDGGPLDAPGLDAPGLDAPGLDAPASADAGRDAPLPPLSCDPGFVVTPSPAVAGRDVAVSFTHATGFVYIGLEATGAGAPTVTGGPITGSGPFTWSFTVRGHARGVLSLAFTADMGANVVGRCEVYVEDGAPSTDAGLDGGPPRTDAGPGTTPPTNRFGIGLVSPGDAFDMDLTADLVGPGGFVKMIFPGVTRDTAGPDPSWVTAVREAYARDLVPVIRMGPPWGDNDVRNDADAGSGYRRYTALGAAYRRVVEGLPLRAGWPLWVEVHNEPNLCYEWTCAPGTVAGDWMPYETAAAEYASMLRDVADALHGMGDARVRVLNGGLAPGGARRCQCGGDGFEAGVTALDFFAAMSAAVPDVFSRIDGLASHSYPAEGMGWGFFVPYDRAGPGLRFFEAELARIGRPTLPVFLTETGWCTPGSRCAMNGGSRDEIATWTERAYTDLWLTHSNVAAVMPFILRDSGGGWNDFAWTDPGGAHFPVYDRVRALRCGRIPGRCP